MKIAIIGATGNAGSRILDEALRRRHHVTALTRNPTKLPARKGLATQTADVLRLDTLVPALIGQDVLISAYNPPRTSPTFTEETTLAADLLIKAVEASKVPRWLMVGGAGSLHLPDGTQLVDSPNFPPEYKTEASAMRNVLTRLKTIDSIDWVMISPAVVFMPGKRTGTFRVGGEQLMNDAQGQSSISMEDFAIAMLNEAEKPAHHRQRFTVGY
jgi:putative NADH-flavin reductase